jgi:hypothetical protein
VGGAGRGGIRVVITPPQIHAINTELPIAKKTIRLTSFVLFLEAEHAGQRLTL